VPLPLLLANLPFYRMETVHNSFQAGHEIRRPHRFPVVLPVAVIRLHGYYSSEKTMRNFMNLSYLSLN
jgi:hypothetical protein